MLGHRYKHKNHTSKLQPINVIEKEVNNYIQSRALRHKGLGILEFGTQINKHL